MRRRKEAQAPQQRRGLRPARTGGRGKRRDLGRTLVWEDEGLHVKKEEKNKHKEFGGYE